MRSRPVYYFHEAYVRKLCRWRFTGGLLIGGFLMFKISERAFERYKKDLKEKYETNVTSDDNTD